MNSENSKLFDPQRLLLNLSNKSTCMYVICMLLYQILTCIIRGKT